MTYSRWVKDHINPNIGGLGLPAVKTQHLTDLYASLLQEGRLRKTKEATGLHPRSVLHVHRICHLMFAAAVSGGFIEQNPCTLIVKRQLPRVLKAEERVLDETEARRLIAASQGTRLHPFIVLALYSGCRKGELLALTWRYVDLDAGRITIAHTLSDEATLAEPKRERSRRTILLPPAAIATLRAHKAAQAALKLAKGPLYQDKGFVFADECGQPWKCQSQATLFKSITKRAGLDARVHPHTMRHTYASLALRAGVPITTLAATLGHDTKTLMDVYGHHIPSAEDTAARAMQVALSAAPNP